LPVRARTASPSAPVILVTSVHLENTSEEARVEQARALCAASSEAAVRTSAAAEMIAGDLNALTRSDFTEEVWKRLCDVAEKRGWEPREERATAVFRTEGFADAGASGPCPSFWLAPAEMPIRIDYVLVRSAHARVSESAVALDSGAEGVSSHKLIACTVAVDFGGAQR